MRLLVDTNLFIEVLLSQVSAGTPEPSSKTARVTNSMSRTSLCIRSVFCYSDTSNTRFSANSSKM